MKVQIFPYAIITQLGGCHFSILWLDRAKKIVEGAGVGSLWEVLLGVAWGRLWIFFEALGKEWMKSYLALGDISVSVPLFHKH